MLETVSLTMLYYLKLLTF